MENKSLLPRRINELRSEADADFAMLAGMQLDVFTPLKNGSMTAEEIAAAIGVAPTRLRLLLYCLVAAELLTDKDGKFSNTPEADHFLVKGSLSYMGNKHASIAQRWSTCLKTAESIRTGVPQAKLDFSNSPPEEIEKFLRNINANTVPAARTLLEKYDFSPVKTLADVGSGGAGIAITISKAHPHIRATAIDLPQVAPIARKIIEEERMDDRIDVIAANVVTDPLPGTYDVAVLRGFLQVLSPEDARLAVKNIGAAVNPGGRIYIIAQILDDSRVSPAEAVGFNLAFINAYDAGESYTESEHRDWLMEAGFVDIERPDFLLDGSGLMTARKRP
jgi:SAM-dependent methyltransferase